MDLLLARGANPGLAANTGATPLSAAVSMRQAEIVDRLLDAGAGLEQRLPGEVTVLMLAAAWMAAPSKAALTSMQPCWVSWYASTSPLRRSTHRRGALPGGNIPRSIRLKKRCHCELSGIYS